MPAQNRPAGIALAVVKAVLGQIVLGVGDDLHLPSLDIEAGEPVVYGHHQPSRAPGDDCAHHLVELDRPVLLRSRIVDVDLTFHDVDPEQDLAPGVPEGAFAQRGLGIEDQFG